MSDVVSRNNSTPQMHNHKKSSSRKTPRRPVTPGKSKATVGRDLWMAALKKRQMLLLPNTYRPGSPRHKTPTEYFIDTLRKTGVGISAETNKSQSLTGLKGNSLHYPYLSTSHYMRNIMGTEKFPQTADPTVRTNTGTPAYKTPEEYYDEVLGLRKQIAALTFENATCKTKIRRLEEENTKKEKEIESLLNPEKNAELRRTMGDRQADSGAIVHSLKQKILKLEMQLKDKESAFCKLQADLKSTKVEEMRVQLEAVYAELMRLQLSKDSGTPDKPKSANNNAAKIKALNETVIRLSRSNEQLQAENKSLKEDLDRALQDSAVHVDTKKEYEDMNRSELLSVIANLEKKLEHVDVDRTSLYSQESARRPQGKMELQGSLEDRLEQLDKRETELLDEVTRLRTVVKKSREDNKRINDTTSLPPTPRRRQSKQMEDDRGSRSSSARVSSRRPSSITHDDRIDSDKRYQGPSEEEVNAFRENRAAKKLQHGWLDYKKRRYDEEMDDAAFTIQEALKGTHARRQRLQNWTSDDYDSSSTVTDDGVYLIQSSLKGHRSRKQHLQKWRNQPNDSDDNDDDIPTSSGIRRPSTTQRSPSVQMQKSPRRPSSGSLSLGRPPSVQRPSSASSSKRGSMSHTFKTKYVSGTSHATESADDDDDDVMF